MIAQLNGKVVLTLIFLLLSLLVVPKNITAEIMPDPSAMHIDIHQVQCMAKNIFYEAGNESIAGQAAVARVVLNRVEHGFAKTPCDVIYQTTTVNDSKICQFSWVCKEKREPNKNTRQYKLAQQVAYDVMVHDRYKDVVPSSVLFFHNLSISPMWQYAEVLTIGNHIFYSRSKKVVRPTKQK